jgi:hypothetical protein
VLVLLACNPHQQPKDPDPFVCKDSSSHYYVLDTVKGYKIRQEVSLPVAINFYMFDNKEEFDKILEPAIDSATINFTNCVIGAILLDNKVDILDHSGNPAFQDVALYLQIDSSRIINCVLDIPFKVKRKEELVYAPSRVAFLVRIPKNLGIHKVYFDNNDVTGIGMSYTLKD